MFDEKEKNIAEENTSEIVEEKAEDISHVEAENDLSKEIDAFMEEVKEPVKATEPEVVNTVKNVKKVSVQPVKKKGRAVKTIALTVVCAALAGIVFSVSSTWMTYITSDPASEVGVVTPGNSEEKIEGTDTALLNYSALANVEGEMTIEDIVDACLPSVVSITNRGVYEVMTFFGNYQTESISSGSGIIIGQNDTELLIVTNYHVVADSKELTVVFSHEEAEALSGDTSYMNVAQIKGYDDEKDIAVIAVKLSEIDSDTKSKIKVAAIGNSDEIKLGSGVVAIGNALGYGQSVTHGIVSAVKREVTMEGVSGGEITNEYIQTDAAINSGNSGGALLNMKGELIGINSAKISATGVEGMGYAIPITDVEELIGNLMALKTREVVAEKDRGYLGITGYDVTTEASQLYGMPVGVFIKGTVTGSPAERSKLESGDIITKIDGVSVSTMTALQDRLSYYAKGETVTLTIKRINGRRYEDMEVDVTLADKKTAGIAENN